MGLIQCSFLVSTMKKVLRPVLSTLQWLVQSAKLVVLAQDEFSCSDVGFYTIPMSIDPKGWTVIFTRKFVKKVMHHLVAYAIHYKVALSNLLVAYAQGMDAGGIMTAPFVVFCSSVKTAEYVIAQSRQRRSEHS